MSRVSWTNPVEYVRPGEAVSAGVITRPDRQISDRLNAVRNRVVAQQGRLVLFEQRVEASVAVGEAVYFDSDTGVFRGALAVTQVVDGRILPAASAEVEGIVIKKSSSTVADILLSGLDQVVLRDEAGSTTPEAGVYYLSGTVAGRLTLTPPSTPIRVARYSSSLGTLVKVDQPSSFDQHRHYEHQLYGSAAAVEEVYIEDGVTKVRLLSANSDLPGWLPASDPIFDGNAPAGAVFGYNLSQDSALKALWPPAPVDAASVTVFSDEQDGFGRELPRELITFDRNGIWLKTRQVSQLPWEVLTPLVGPSSSSSAGSFGDGVGTQKKAVIYFHRSRYAADRTAVTTLRPASSEGPIRIVNCEGDDAVTGDLLLEYDPDAEVVSNSDLSAIAVKEFIRGGTLKRGPVAVGLIPGDETIILESDDSRPLVESEPLGDRIYYGLVRVRAAIEASERLIPPQIVSLNGVQQRYADDMLLSLGLKENTSLTLKFVLPGPVGFPTNARASLRLWLVGGVATPVPPLTIITRRLPRVTSESPLPVSDESLTFESPGILAVDHYVEVDTTDSIEVAAGDVVTIRISREADDGYDAELQLVNIWLRLFRET